jgi:hypothetical protein
MFLILFSKVLYEKQFVDRWHSWFVGNLVPFVGPCIDVDVT